MAKRRTGVSLVMDVAGPGYESPSYGQVNLSDASAIHDRDRLHLFLTNRSLDRSHVVGIEIADREITGLVDGEMLTGPDAKAVNSFEQPDLIRPQSFDDPRLAGGAAEVELPPLSVLALTLQLA